MGLVVPGNEGELYREMRETLPGNEGEMVKKYRETRERYGT